METSSRSVATAALAAVLAVAGYLGEPALIAAAIVLVLAVAVGWPVLLGMPGSLGATVTVALGGMAGVVVVALTNGEPYLRLMPMVIAATIVLAFVNELARGAGRTRVVESVSGVVTGALIAVCAAGWIAAGRSPAGSALVVASAAALAAASAVAALRWSPWLVTVVAVIAAGGVGAGVSQVMPGLSAPVGGLIGLASAILVATVRQFMRSATDRRDRAAAIAAVTVPVSVSGIVAYIVGRVLLG